MDYIQDIKNKEALIISEKSFIKKDKLLLPEDFKQYVDDIVIPYGLINDRIEHLASSIYLNENEVTFLVIMKGGINFANLLNEKLNYMNKIGDKLFKYDFEYLSVSSYYNGKSTGKLVIKSDESILSKLKGKRVIIVEDICDTGFSMSLLLDLLKRYEFKSLKIALLILKANKENLKYGFTFDYIGFIVPNVLLLGWGFDFNEKFRDVEHICKMNENSRKILAQT